jgi:hypothetical protein
MVREKNEISFFFLRNYFRSTLAKSGVTWSLDCEGIVWNPAAEASSITVLSKTTLVLIFRPTNSPPLDPALATPVTVLPPPFLPATPPSIATLSAQTTPVTSENKNTKVLFLFWQYFEVIALHYLAPSTGPSNNPSLQNGFSVVRSTSEPLQISAGYKSNGAVSPGLFNFPDWVQANMGGVNSDNLKMFSFGVTCQPIQFFGNE